jgi:hypothetical protein
MLKICQFAAFALLGSVNCFAPPTAHAIGGARRAHAPCCMANPLVAAMQKVSKWIKTPEAPTAADIEAYCRDPESSGCDLELMDALMAEAAKLRTREATLEKTRSMLGELSLEPVRWHNDDGSDLTT